MKGQSILKIQQNTHKPNREPAANKIDMNNKKFLSQIALANENEEDLLKAGP